MKTSHSAHASRRRPDRAAGTNTPPSPPPPVRIGYFNPDASTVSVVGSFNGWNPAATPMRRDALGDWVVELRLPRGEHRYRLMVDGAWRDDPSATQTAPNPYGGYDAVILV